LETAAGPFFIIKVKGHIFMKRLLTFLGVIFFCCTVPCCTNNTEKNNEAVPGIVAKAGSITVTTRDLSEVLANMPGPQQFEYLSDKGRYVLLDMLIDWKLFAQAAIKAGLDQDADVKKKIKETHTDLEREQVLGNEYLQYRIGQLEDVSDGQIRDYYEQNTSDFALPERVRVQRILFATEDRAKAALSEVKGGMAFEQYKEAFPEERIKVDSLWLQTGGKSTSLHDAVKELAVGDMSAVIATGSGSCIVRVMEKSPARVLTIDEVRERLRSQLQNSNKRKLITNLRQSLRENLSIDTNSSLLDSYQCEECTGKAVPRNNPPLTSANPAGRT
jgi:peptidyl-prolyl cis-trans isomerase C